MAKGHWYSWECKKCGAWSVYYGFEPPERTHTCGGYVSWAILSEREAREEEELLKKIRFEREVFGTLGSALGRSPSREEIQKFLQLWEQLGTKPTAKQIRAFLGIE